MLRNSLRSTSFLSFSLLAACACSPSGPSAEDVNKMLGSSGSSGGSTPVTGGAGGAAGAAMAGGSGGSAGSSQSGAAGMTTGGGGTGGAMTGGAGGSGGQAPVGPYDPRSGSFKMLVLTRTAGYRHDSAINAGVPMLTQIAQEQGFGIDFKGSVIVPNDPDETQRLSIAEIDATITAENLANYEIIFHLNTTGDMLNDEQQAIYEQWMRNKYGAFAGTHSATDTEQEWDFYSEVTGQYYNGHGNQNVPDQIQFEADAVDFIALKDLPNPWQRNEEWYLFNSHQAWSAKPGFKILGRKAADGQPCMWTREWSNFRSFYTCIGHDGVVFEDPNVKKLLTGAIMWAVRRDHLIK